MSKHSKNKKKLFTKDQERFWDNTNKELMKEIRGDRLKNDTITLKIEKKAHDKLKQKSKQMDVPKSFIIQELIYNFIGYESK